MAVIPLNLARVSNNLRSYSLLETLRGTQTRLFGTQTQLSTGLRFTRPSEDPVRALHSLVLDRQMDRVHMLEGNLRQTNAVLTEGESAARDAIDLMTEAQPIVSSSVSDFVSADERRSLASVVDSILERMVSVGNRRYLNNYLFAGHYGDSAPFELTADGVLYKGDRKRTEAIVETDLKQDAFKVSGAEFFQALSPAVRGTIDLDPIVSADTRVEDLLGQVGQGVRLGRIEVANGASRFEIDVAGAATVGEIVDRINDAMPGEVAAAVGTKGVVIAKVGGPPGAVVIRDVAGGRTALDLGLAGPDAEAASLTADLKPKLTKYTPLGALRDGAGVSTFGGLRISNGSKERTIDLDTAESVEDILNAINTTDLGVWARIGDDDATIEVVNRVSGSDLRISDNGGTIAASLGILSMQPGTTLTELNDGRGVQTVDGADLRIVTRDGSTIEIDVDGAATLQDVVDRLNAAGAGRITAALRNDANGLLITDNTAGGGTLRAERINYSPALADLGLEVAAVGNQLLGTDVNPVRVDSPFTALLELRDALRADDRLSMSRAGERLERVMLRMQESQGHLAAMAQAMAARDERTADTDAATRVLLSDLRDADFTEAAVRFQQLQTALQANLATASRIAGLSLIDFLR